MSSEENALLKLLFPEGVSSEWDYNIKFNEYISKLGGYKIEDLCKEPVKLQDEKNSILEQTQDLAVTNYKTFIETADCSRQLFTKFKNIDSDLDKLLEHLPKFETRSQTFSEESSGVNNLRKLNSLTLTRNAQLLEILELPQLMQSFIDDELYEDALELASYVRKLQIKHPDIPILKSILDDVEKAWFLMLYQLLAQLKEDLNLPKCLQIVSHLRRMEVFSETELRLKFLQTRNCFLQKILKTIPTEDVNHHLNKTIEITRVNLFNIVTQYRAIFNDDDHNPLGSLKAQQVNPNVIFFSWIRDKISEFLNTLEFDLSRGASSTESILGQCMYFGLSFSKVGCDFRSLLIPIFTNRILTTFNEAIDKATQNFGLNIERFSIINKNYTNVPWKSRLEDPLQPPESLLEFYPLAEYINNLVAALNELRLCAPMSIINEVCGKLQRSLAFVAKTIQAHYVQVGSFYPKDAFTRLCMAFTDDVVPYIQKCIHVIYPTSGITSRLGINVNTLQKRGISFMDKNAIVAPIHHLLPVKVEPVSSEFDEGKSKEHETLISEDSEVKEDEVNEFNELDK